MKVFGRKPVSALDQQVEDLKLKERQNEATETREILRRLNILEHDYDVLNQEMTDVVKKLARVERKAYRNDVAAGPDPADPPKNQAAFWVPGVK
jgi:hypothetical protein